MFLTDNQKEVKNFSYAKIKYFLVPVDFSIFDNNQWQQLVLKTIEKDVGEENSFWILWYHVWNKSIILWFFGEFWIMELHWHKIYLGSFIIDRVLNGWEITGLFVNIMRYGSELEHKQPSRDVLTKRCFENMRQIYRRTPLRKCDFNKVALQLYRNRTSAWVFYCKFAAYFQNTFS